MRFSSPLFCFLLLLTLPGFGCLHTPKTTLKTMWIDEPLGTLQTNQGTHAIQLGLEDGGNTRWRAVEVKTPEAPEEDVVVEE